MPYLLGRFQSTKEGRNVHKHGHGSSNRGPCEGSYRLPSSIRSAAPVNESSSQQRNNSQESQPSPVSQSPDDIQGEPYTRLQHPPWTPFITRVPKAARATCATVLLFAGAKEKRLSHASRSVGLDIILWRILILQRIISSPTDLEAWDNLFSFAPAILAKPARGEATRNLANLKRLSACNDKPTSQSIPPRGVQLDQNIETTTIRILQQQH